MTENNNPANELQGTKIRIFTTNADKPDKGRIFIWTKIGWFERIEGESGGIAYIPAAASEQELREYISRDPRPSDLVPLHGELRKTVAEEFVEQSFSYRDSPQYSEEESSEDSDQQFHQHD
jgi:hypothetical protein